MIRIGDRLAPLSPAGKAGTEPRTRPALDGVRGCAVIEVFLYHAFSSHAVYGQRAVARFGYLGVEAFFVLSGFLITLRLLDLDPALSRREQWRRFLLRRAARIAPLYYATLIAVALVGSELDFEVRREAWVWFSTLSVNILIFLRGSWVGAGGHLWSVCVEEQFYLALPALLLTRARRHAGAVLAFLVLLTTTLRVLQGLDHGLGPWGFTLPLLHLDAFGAGALAAMASRRSAGTAAARRWVDVVGAAAWAAFLGIACLAPSGPLHLVAALLHGCLCIAVAWLVYTLWNGRLRPIGWLLGTMPIRGLGKISYGFYVCHLFVLVALWQYRAPWLPPVALLRGAMAFGISVAMATVSWLCFERPIVEWMRRGTSWTAMPEGGTQVGLPRGLNG